MESSSRIRCRDVAADRRRVKSPKEEGGAAPFVRDAPEARALFVCALLAMGAWVRAAAADYTWDCNTTSGIQPCGGSLSDQRFTTNGTNLVTWPGGTNTMVFAGDDGIWDISVPGTSSIGGLTVSKKGYSLTGSGALELASTPAVFEIGADIAIAAKLGGSGGFDKRGNGTLTLSGRNDHKGVATVRSGTLKVGVDSFALGDTAGATTVASGGTLDIDGHFLGREQLYLDGGGIVNRGTSLDIAFRRLTVRANSTLGGSGRFGIRKADDANSVLRVDSGVTLLKTDTNIFILGGLPLSVDGRVEVRSGLLVAWGGTTFSGSGDYLIDSGGGFVFAPDKRGVNMTNPVRAVGTDLLIYGDSLSGRTDFSNTLTLEGGITTMNCASSAIVSGTLAGNGRLRKWSDSTLVLAGDNPYKGVLDAVSGMVQIGNGGSTGSIASDSILLGTSLVFDHTGTKTFAGAIAGKGRLTRRGNGTDIFTGNITHKGGTTIAAGTLQIGSGGSTGSIVGTIVNNGALVFDHSSGVLYHGDSIRGTGGLVKRGAGVLALGGRCSYTGTTTVSGGKFVVMGALVGTNVSVASGGSLGGTGSISGSVSITSGAVLDPGQHDSSGVLRTGGLTIASGGRASFRIGTDSNHVVVDGDFAIYGAISLQAGPGIKEGTYTLFTAKGAISTSGTTIDSVPRGFKATLSSANGRVTVKLELVGADLHWDCGAESGLQPCDGMWTERKFSTDSVHLVSWSEAGNRAFFAGADGSHRIGNKGNRVVDSLVFLASGYRLVGDSIALAKGIRVEAGKSDTIDTTIISGPGIVLDGGGTLVLRNSGNQRFGSLTVARGTYVAQRTGGTTGNKLGTGNVTIAEGATLVLRGLLQGDTCSNPVFLSGSGSGKGGLFLVENYYGVTINGPIVLRADAKIGSETYNATKPTSLAGTIGGPYDLTLSSYRGVLRSTEVISIGGDLTTNQTGTVMLYKQNTYTGNTVVSSGTLRLGADSVIPDGTGKGNVEVSGVLDMNGFDETVNGLSGSGTIYNTSSDTSTLTIGNNDRTSTFGGTIRDSTGRLNLVKLGAGRLTLSGNSPFSGATGVDGGELIVDGHCDSTTITVNAGAVLGGSGSTGAIVVSSGVLRPGGVDGIGVLKAVGADLSGGDASTLLVRARGSATPGTDHDRLDLAGTLELGGRSVLRVDLNGFSGSGTVAGVVRAASVTGRFSRVDVQNSAGHAVAVRYTENSVDLLVEAIASRNVIDTTIPAGSDSVFVTLGGGVVMIVPPRQDPRRVRMEIVDSTLGHGIAGADTALVIDAGASATQSIVIRAPIGLVPATGRIAGEIPSVYRLDSLGKVRIVSSLLRADSTLDFVAIHDGGFWLGFDTIAPVVTAVVERDSLPSGDSTRVTWSMRDNVADAAAWMCVLRAGRSTSECVTLANGDSLEGAWSLSQVAIPLGAAVRVEGRDARRVSATPWQDVVVAIDTLRAPEERQEDRYELASFPYAPESRRAHQLFTSMWGGDDPGRWRVYTYDSTRFDEIIAGDTVASLGRAFWVRTRRVSRVSWVAGGWTSPVTVSVPVALRPGWNMVGNPLGFDVDWKRALELSGIDTMDVAGPYGFDGAKQEWTLPESTTTLRAWKGVALLNTSGRTLELRVPSVAPAAVAARATARTIPVRIAVRSAQGGRSSARIWMGIDPACVAAGCRSHPMPPSPGNALDLHLPSRGSRADGAFLADVRGVTDSVQKWAIHIEGLVPDVPLLLEVERSGTDTSMPVLVRDDKADRWLRLGSRMEFAVGGESKRTFTFLAGGDVSLLGRGGLFALQARGRSVRWCIPPEMGRTQVRIELRDLAGRRTELLLDETMDAGSYVRELGVPATSSPRLVVLRAGGRVQSAPLVRLR